MRETREACDVQTCEVISTSAGDPLRAWARSLPKVELHRHLEGSLRLNTLTDIARDYDIDSPAYDSESLRPYVQVTTDWPDFPRFLEKFKVLRRFYTSKQILQRITREAISDAARDHVIHLELRFNPLALAQAQEFAYQDVVAWVVEAAEEAQKTTGTRTVLLLQIPRNEPLNVAHEIVDLAIAHQGEFVRGIDLAGDEVHYPPERFIEPFARAREAGLNITAHAGEAVGPESVRATMLALHPQRIGHGIRSVENSEVVQMLRERDIALEICPTSNLHTGAVRVLAEHPLIDLFSLGLNVTLNTDDPSVSATTLSDEYVLAVREIGIDLPRIYRMLRYAVEATFISPSEKRQLRSCVQTALAAYPDAQEAFDGALAAR
ncbi:MAG: adenosine deaminase [Anaerolineae bacterium]